MADMKAPHLHQTTQSSFHRGCADMSVYGSFICHLAANYGLSEWHFNLNRAFYSSDLLDIYTDYPPFIGALLTCLYMSHLYANLQQGLSELHSADMDIYASCICQLEEYDLSELQRDLIDFM